MPSPPPPRPRGRAHANVAAPLRMPFVPGFPGPEPEGLWRLRTGEASAGPTGDPHGELRSLNKHAGRQTWEWEAGAGTPEERAEVDRLRAAFTANRGHLRHSADELLRAAARRRANDRGVARPPEPPAAGLAADDPTLTTPSPEITRDALRAGVSFYATLQEDDGHWPGDYGGPLFLMPGLVVSCHVCGIAEEVLTPETRREMARYIWNHQREDGGFGLHVEGASTQFGSCLNYVALRLLGVDADVPGMKRCRAWILERGGAVTCTSWGKFWLALLGCYEWRGQNPLPPEMWLLPHATWTGVGWLHPGRFWCHCRMVYLPMCWLYGARARAAETETIRALREELFVTPYCNVDWDAAREQCATEDLYFPRPLVQSLMWWVMDKVWEPLVALGGPGVRPGGKPSPEGEPPAVGTGVIGWVGSAASAFAEATAGVFHGVIGLLGLRTTLFGVPPTTASGGERAGPLAALRRAALREVAAHIVYEDNNTRHVDIGPVSKGINMCVCYFAYGPESRQFRCHVPRLQDYLWVAEDGMKMQARGDGKGGKEPCGGRDRPRESVRAVLRRIAIAASLRPSLCYRFLAVSLFLRATMGASCGTRPSPCRRWLRQAHACCPPASNPSSPASPAGMVRGRAGAATPSSPVSVVRTPICATRR